MLGYFEKLDYFLNMGCIYGPYIDCFLSIVL